MLRVTRQHANVAYSTDSNIRVSRQFVEVLIKRPAANSVIVSAGNTLVFDQSPLGFVDKVGLGVSTLVVTHSAAGHLVAEKGSNVLTLTQDATAATEAPDRAANVLAITQDVEFEITKARQASNTLEVSHSAVPSGPRTASASNTLVVGQSGRRAEEYLVTPFNVLTVSQSAMPSGTKYQSASNVLSVVNAVDATDKRRDAVQTIPLAHAVEVVKSKLAKNTLVITQTVDRDIRATGTTSLVTLTHSAVVPWDAPSRLEIRHSVEVYRPPGTKMFYDRLRLSQSAVAGNSAVRSVPQTLALRQAVAYLIEPGTVAVTPGPGESPFDRRARRRGNYFLCNYAPFIGAGDGSTMPPPATLPPPLVGGVTKGLQLFYPVASPTLAVDVEKSMAFGDMLRFGFDRIAEESRGGSLRVYVDPMWPTRRSLVFSVERVKRDTAMAVLDFLEATLGYEIGVRTHEGRAWVGVVINPNEAVVQNHRDAWTFYIELEGEEA